MFPEAGRDSMIGSISCFFFPEGRKPCCFYERVRQGMPNSKMFRPVVVGKKKRYTYARSQEVLKMPHLLDLQTKSYEWFCKEGLKDVFADISPIEDSAKKWALHFGDFYFGKGNILFRPVHLSFKGSDPCRGFFVLH